MDWEKLDLCLKMAHEIYHVPAGECRVMHKGKVLYYQCFGFADSQQHRPVSPEDMYYVFSLSKIFTNFAAMQLVEKGLLQVDDLVEDYLPSWKDIQVRDSGSLRSPKTRPTIENLMTMTAGLNYELTTPEILQALRSKGDQFHVRDLADALAISGLDFDPGEHFCYSLCHDVLGAVLEKVSGKDLETLMKDNIWSPCGMKDITFFPGSMSGLRASDMYVYNEETGMVLPNAYSNEYVPAPNLVSGGAGLYSTSQNISIIMDVLANGGISTQGVQIISEDSINEMKTNRLAPLQLSEFRNMKPDPYGYGYGVRTRLRNKDGVPEGEFGWDGAAGSYALADPSTGLSLVYMQHIRGHGPCYEIIHPCLTQALYRDFSQFDY